MSLLDSLAQQIHATLLSPPAKFLLTSGRALDDQWWRVRLFWNGDRDGKTEVRVWTADINLDEVSATEEDLAAAIETGMLHVDCGRRSVDLSALDELSLHVLIQPKPIITYLTLGKVEDYVGQLIEVNYKLLSRPVATKEDPSEVKKLRSQLVRKDEEIATIRSKMSNLSSQGASRGSDYKSSPSQSPQKPRTIIPKNASKIQPNQKRRRVMQEEFASDSDSD
ncbi:hypothetical protein CND05053 [Cryptococcus deneoformans JEC21]|uniref:Uncharacterized protein n=1 Tax=Cryptococcus deneoformans (strain JEC21 / ATCC MYA-565) TaxID=214684 RepID=A0A0S2LIU4_CRYD1|nr:hypothetical protein CND05053 [Cryptococcus neoformans var. neoformans JEC21]ALO60541.1 hypothetical protein CND05053 [Cryptococcus neoformans var. neoformans JEC21]